MTATTEAEVLAELGRRGQGEPSRVSVPEATVNDMVHRGLLRREMHGEMPVYRPAEECAA